MERNDLLQKQQSLMENMMEVIKKHENYPEKEVIQQTITSKKDQNSIQNEELNQVKPVQDSSSEEEDYDYEEREVEDREDIKQMNYEQELQYTKPWYVNQRLNGFSRKHVKVKEKDLNEEKLVLKKFWKKEEKEKQPVGKKCLKKNYRLLNQSERYCIQLRDKRNKIYSVKKI